MPEPHRLLQDARIRALSLSRALFSRLEEYSDDYQGSVPQRLIEKLKRSTVAIEETIDRTERIESIGFICTVITDLTRDVLPILDHAHRAQTPRGLWQIIDQLHKSLRLEGETFPATSDTYEYTIADHGDLYIDLCDDPGNPSRLPGIIDVKRWHQIFDDFPSVLSIVRFPRLERDNVLLCPIFGHELGHRCFNTLGAAPSSGNWPKSAITKSRALLRRLEARDLIDRVGLEAEFMATIEAAYNRGLQELLSDLVAVRIFGPSALFAAAEFLIPDGLDGLPAPEQFYPPTRRRLREMIAELDKMGHLRALEELPLPWNDPGRQSIKSAVLGYISELRVLTLDTSDEKNIEKEELLRIAYGKLRKTLAAGSKHAAHFAKAAEYSPNLIATEIAEALTNLNLGVPPTQIGKYGEHRTINWRSAILAGWMKKIHISTGYEGSKTWAETKKSIDKCKELTLRGVEDIFLLEDYAHWADGRKQPAEASK